MSEAVSTGLWRDFRYYVLWWMFWASLFSVLQPVADVGEEFGVLKALQFGFGLLWGAILGTTFTVAQNTINKPRRRPVSWMLAIGTAIAANLVFFALWR